MSIDALLVELDSWFNQPDVTPVRAKFLSKLATLEYCGWLEERFDEMVFNVATACGVQNSDTVKSTIKSNHGFTYTLHLREMLVAAIGERGVGAAELLMRAAHPNQLEGLMSGLATLKLVRGHLAHNSSLASVPQQVTIYAPSWCINQQRVVAKQVDRLEACLMQTSRAIHAAV